MSARLLSAPRPVILRKNAREEVRVSVDEFKGLRLLNIRVWLVGDDGQMRPGKQGVAVRLELAPDLAQAIREVTAWRVRASPTGPAAPSARSTSR